MDSRLAFIIFFFLTVTPSIFDVRLISAIRGLVFTSLVEVNYNNRGWGTLCDYISDANVICRMLNHDGAACAVSNAQFGRGAGNLVF